MTFRAPMLATAMTHLPPGKWVWEKKLDGWRLLVRVQRTFVPAVQAWSRTGKAQILPQHLYDLFMELPDGYYDGEALIPGLPATSVATAMAKSAFPSERAKLHYHVFDVLELNGFNLTSRPWVERRAQLVKAVQDHTTAKFHLVEALPVRDWQHALDVAGEQWEDKGEGIIVKDTSAKYEEGKRRKTFIKIKEVQPACFPIIGFAPSEGEVNGYGDFGTAVLWDAAVNIFLPVKVLDDEVRQRLANADTAALREERSDSKAVWRTERLLSGKKITFHTNHPWVGKYLHIEYQMRTADGSYRHPRWDRLEGE